MKDKKLKGPLGIIIILVVIVAAYLMWQSGLNSSTVFSLFQSNTKAGNGSEIALEQYRSENLKLSFTYPETYFTVERELGDEHRYHYQIALFEDTPENRDVVAGKTPGREGPVSITIDAYQNNLDKQDVESWIKNSNDSNFKLSDGTLSPVRLGNTPAFLYRHTGLYENDALVFSHRDNIIKISVSFISLDDPIRLHFVNLVNSLTLE